MKFILKFRRQSPCELAMVTAYTTTENKLIIVFGGTEIIILSLGDIDYYFEVK